MKQLELKIIVIILIVGKLQQIITQEIIIIR